MELLVAAVVLLPLLVLMICVLLKKKRHPECVENDSRVFAVLLGLDFLVIIAGLAVSGPSGSRLMFDLSISLVPAVIYVFRIFDEQSSRRLLFCSVAVLPSVGLLHILGAAGVVRMPTSASMVWASMLVVFILSFVVVVKTVRQVADMNLVMKQGTVWSYINICSDCVYMVSVSFSVSFALLFCDLLDSYDGYHLALVNLLLGYALCGLYFRKLRNSPFAVMLRHEKAVLESIKDSHLGLDDAAMSDDSSYRVVYERLIEYFEKEKPFLRSDLTINDLVKVIYSNKLYISRAISLCSGRNFRQFVNFYRVQYSCEIYRENPTLKIVELSQACGFNTVASFNMAFRLFMNQTPGEWCRKEKARISTIGVVREQLSEVIRENIPGTLRESVVGK